MKILVLGLSINEQPLDLTICGYEKFIANHCMGRERKAIAQPIMQPKFLIFPWTQVFIGKFSEKDLVNNHSLSMKKDL